MLLHYREQVQLQSNVAQLQQQFDVCQEVQRSMQLEMSNWRVAFSGFTHALNPSADAIATSQLMQISPVGGEGSNIMPRQGSRPDPPELRGLQGSSPQLVFHKSCNKGRLMLAAQQVG